MTTPKIGLCQINNNHLDIFSHVREEVNKLDDDVDIIVLPECFNSPYDMKFFKDIAEEKGSGSVTYKFLQTIAQTKNAYVIGGSFITKKTFSDGAKYYNSCYVFDRTGKELGCYDKIHLFNVTLPDKRYRESDYLTAGEQPLVVHTEFGNIGIGICFDLRFPNLAKYYCRKYNCSILCYPGAFTMLTGEKHYELLLRSRAVDNQCYVIGCAPARDTSSSYVTWSNSTVVDPWGKVILNLGHEVNSKCVQLDLTLINHVRGMIPIYDDSQPWFGSPVGYTEPKPLYPKCTPEQLAMLRASQLLDSIPTSVYDKYPSRSSFGGFKKGGFGRGSSGGFESRPSSGKFSFKKSLEDGSSSGFESRSSSSGFRFGDGSGRGGFGFGGGRGSSGGFESRSSSGKFGFSGGGSSERPVPSSSGFKFGGGGSSERLVSTSGGFKLGETVSSERSLSNERREFDPEYEKALHVR